MFFIEILKVVKIIILFFNLKENMAINTSLGSYTVSSISTNESRWRITNSPLFNRATSSNTSLIFEKMEGK